jgi:hypothetical protein
LAVTRDFRLQVNPETGGMVMVTSQRGPQRGCDEGDQRGGQYDPHDLTPDNPHASRGEEPCRTERRDGNGPPGKKVTIIVEVNAAARFDCERESWSVDDRAGS